MNGNFDDSGRPLERAAPQSTIDQPWKGVALPEGFEIDRQGVHRTSDKTNICGPLWVAATTCDPISNDHGLLIKWINIRNKECELAILRDELHATANTLAARLARLGLRISPGKENPVRRYLAEFDSDRLPHWNSVSRVGWIEGELAYMTPPPRGLISAGQHAPVIFQPERQSPSMASLYSSGSLEQWNEFVIGRCRNNPLLLFGPLVGLAGPLLRFAEAESGGFHLYGRSSHGKTTAAQAAASVWGNGADPAEAPDRAYVQKWNSTHNAFEALLSAHNDGLLVLDEIHTCDSKDFGAVLYNMAGGKGRNALDKERQLRAPRKWRAMFLSTGEVSALNRIQHDGGHVHAGQLTRLVDIPIEGGIIVDSGNQEPRAFADSLKHACARYFGTAGPAFVGALTHHYESVPQLIGTVKMMVESYTAKLTPQGAPPEHQRVIKRFALIAVAGALAVHLGVLNCTVAQVENAVLTALRAWQSGGAMLPDRVRGLVNVQRFIQQHESRFQHIPRNEREAIPRDRAGYVSNFDVGVKGPAYLFTDQGFLEACGDQDSRETARELKERGFLFANEPNRSTVKRSLDGGARGRVYVVAARLLEFDPREAEDTRTGATGASGAIAASSVNQWLPDLDAPQDCPTENGMGAPCPVHPNNGAGAGRD